jgi:hypothetical protein
MDEESIGSHKFPSALAEVIWSALTALEEDEYAGGRTAAYWHIMAILDRHMVRNHNG